MSTACVQCTTSLMGKRYILCNEAPTCLNCYETVFAHKCDKCHKVIGTDAKDVSYKGKHFHEDCFLCAGCNNTLANQQFITQGTDLICTTCYETKFAEKCESCKKTFKHGMQRVEYGGKQYHYDCFVCSQCRKPIGSSSFMPNDGKIICTNCYNTHHASKCGGCSKIIDKSAVKFGGLTYHKECFVCKGCKAQLAGIKFATKDDIPYCQECYVNQFSKKCDFCKGPISGLGTSTKFCSFEDRHWHTQCFNCSACSKSLLGEGFLMQDENIVCMKCGNSNDD